jgi:moderate conductance mechanosensitive channel
MKQMTTQLQFYKSLPSLAQNWVNILIFFLLAWLLSRLAGILSRRVIRLGGLAAHRSTPERRKTLYGLVQGIITVTFFGVAILLSLSQFVETTTLIWMVGLFGAGFGLSARPLISDVMAGTSFIFEDTFAVGEKVEILNIEGIIETITLRTTWLRAPTGELYTIPNGDIRVVRNFSRGRFSTANIILKIPAAELEHAIPLLENLGQEAMDSLPNLIEPWRVISETGIIGQTAELTLLAKARFGQAAEMRTRLLAMVHKALEEENIELMS